MRENKEIRDKLNEIMESYICLLKEGDITKYKKSAYDAKKQTLLWVLGEVDELNWRWTMTLITIITTIIFGLLYALEADKTRKLREMYYELLEESASRDYELQDYYKEY